MSAAPDEAPFRVGECFARELTFDAASIRAFATMVGDTNPLHHDEAAAARFGGLIASGTQVSSLMLGIVADALTQRTPSLGMEIGVRFRRPVRAGTTLRAEWTITAVEPKASLGGYILTLAGQLAAPGGEVAATATATSLVTPPAP